MSTNPTTPTTEGTITWRPIEEAPERPNYEKTFLLWCPGLRVSGPAMVAYKINGLWVSGWTGNELPYPATHYAEINAP